MDLGHRPVDTPMGSECTPAADELLPGFREFHKPKLDDISEFSKFIENFISRSDRLARRETRFIIFSLQLPHLQYHHPRHAFYPGQKADPYPPYRRYPSVAAPTCTGHS